MAQAEFETAGSAPHLNQAEQDLLLNALKSNQPKGAANGGTLNPEATFNSQADTSLFLDDDTSFLESHFDTSNLNWDIDPATLADLQNDNTQESSHSVDGDDDGGDGSPIEQSGDKRKDRSDEDALDEEGGKKRRESMEKVAKKPGRKPMTSEPTSKRKAQNRAAQRAFRERKEKHLRDLEQKVEDLEKASEATNHENGVLRAQVDRLQAELSEYKKHLPATRPSYSPQQSMNKFNWDIGQNFDFEFPKFGGDNSLAQKANESSSNSFTWSPSPLTTTRTMSTSTSTTNNYFGGSDLNKARSPTASTDKSVTNSESPASLGIGSSVCTTPETCADSPGQYKGGDKSGSLTSVDLRASASPSQPKTPGQDNVQSLDWYATRNNGLFDPILISDAYREPQDNILNNADLNLSFFDDAFPWNPASNYSAPFSSAGTFNPATAVKGSLMDQVEQAAEGKEHDAFKSVTLPGVVDDAKVKHITCAKLWERVQRSEKVLNGEADMDDLCSQLKAKAKCGGPNKGAVVDEADVDAILGPDPQKKGMYGMFK